MEIARVDGSNILKKIELLSFLRQEFGMVLNHAISLLDLLRFPAINGSQEDLFPLGAAGALTELNYARD
ncbi:MAG: hypothetical protein EXQ56_02040 [Acidobacteria bacterium]|nr:hypothetical protein [Acidobacteriota bacterium]